MAFSTTVKDGYTYATGTFVDVVGDELYFEVPLTDGEDADTVANKYINDHNAYIQNILQTDD
jgi:hypothetical protein